MKLFFALNIMLEWEVKIMNQRILKLFLKIF